MPMTLPSQVICNELIWEITRGSVASEDSPYGLCDKPQCRVTLAADGPEQVQHHTFWHEVFHMLQASYDLPSKRLDEEDIAAHYGAALAGFILRNCEITWKSHE